MPVDENDGGMLEESLGGDMTSNPEAVFMENTLSSLLTDENSTLFSSMERRVLNNTLRARNIPRLQSCWAKAIRRLTMRCRESEKRLMSM